jgi:hypothetical protein
VSRLITGTGHAVITVRQTRPQGSFKLGANETTTGRGKGRYLAYAENFKHRGDSTVRKFAASAMQAFCKCVQKYT